MVVQHLYNDMSFNSPFLLVYIGTSLFSVYLPSRWGYEKWGARFSRWRRRCRSNYEEGCSNDGVDEDAVVIIPWSNRNHHAIECEDAEERMPMSYASTSRGDERNGHRALEIGPVTPDEVTPTSLLPILSHVDHISMAAKVAPLWFASNYCYAISLRWTSIASSTVLASMGSIFAYGFATCTRFGDERVTWGKVVGVALCFMGGVATAYTDVGGGGGSSSVNDGMDDTRRILRFLQPATEFSNEPSARSLLGDLAGLFSAMGYGAYTVLLRHLCPKDENRMSMQLLFGYVGILNMIALSPVAIWILVPDHNSQSSEEGSPSPDYNRHATTLTGTILLFLIGKGLLDNVISDYLWARAVILTSATVASVGLGLTIPMAFFADKVMVNNSKTQLGDVLGALCVLSGFVFVNIGEEEKRTTNEGDDVEFEDIVETIGTVDVVHNQDKSVSHSELIDVPQMD